MRQEADIKAWGDLYKLATRINEAKPWELFKNTDIICLKETTEETSAYVNIQSDGQALSQIVVYEGFCGLNCHMMKANRRQLHLTNEYAASGQSSLNCIWGGREDLAEKQRKIIRELGYKYRGRNQWLHFTVSREGYYPYMMDQEEVSRMTHYLELLLLAMKRQKANAIQIENAQDQMYCLDVSGDDIIWMVKALPFTAYQFGENPVDSEVLKRDLKRMNQNDQILEMDVCYLGTAVSDPNSDILENPRLCIIGNLKAGVMLKADMVEAEEDPYATMAEELVRLMETFGIPAEIRVGNAILQKALEEICNIAGIRLHIVERLPMVQNFMVNMRNLQEE